MRGGGGVFSLPVAWYVDILTETQLHRDGEALAAISVSSLA